ncbi:MAG: hypothetical protein HZB19_04555 [Chloroflexi bacterium]|nr:hypothetical protein [Chloroflexota bacterium]
MNNLLELEKIHFAYDQEAICVFPNDVDELEQAILLMGIKDHPVIVLIGGHILPEHDAVHRRAIEIIAKTAEEMDAVIICGGTDVGVMSAIGQERGREQYQFPLIGIAPEDLVTWPGAAKDSHPLASSVDDRVPLEPHHSHFILIPGNEFGDESSWIVHAASFISKDRHKSVTILANGGAVSQKDIELGLLADRPLIVLKGTGRLADEIAHRPKKNNLVKVVQANNKRMLTATINSLLW